MKEKKRIKCEQDKCPLLAEIEIRRVSSPKKEFYCEEHARELILNAKQQGDPIVTWLRM